MLLFLYLCLAIPTCWSANIVAYFMTPSYSHQMIFQAIWKELSLRGHKVTVFTPNPLNDPTLTNLTEIDLGFSYDIWNNHGISTMGTTQHTTLDEFQALSETCFAVTDGQVNNPVVQQFLKESRQQKWDLYLVEYLWPQFFALKYIFNCPMVGISSMALTEMAHAFIGNPINPALEPDFLLPFSRDLTFFQRVLSTVIKASLKYGFVTDLGPRTDALSKKYFGVNRSISEIASEVSLVLVNSNVALHNVLPTVPAYIEISGIHIKEKKPLPNDLKKYLDEAKEGVIYFSLGSNVRSESLPKEQKRKFGNVFKKLPYNILWKFESDHLPDQPENVMIKQWLPQQDLLGHSNIKLFITQGGAQSLDEAIHNEVPVLSIPFFGDQRHNSHHLVATGWGLAIDFHAFTEQELENKITEIITNPKYKETVRRLHKVVTDQPESALEKAVWWIEYVLRHDGASHLRYKGIDMPLYQYLLLDIIAYFLVIGILLICVLRKLFRMLTKPCHRTANGSDKKML